jgi:DNA-binding MarR family transcriptional regulator
VTATTDPADLERPRRPVDPTIERVEALARQLHLLFAEATADLTEVDLTMAQLRGLGLLHLHGCMSVGEFAAAMHMRMASGSALAERLHRAGFITRREASEDRRRTLVELSPHALDLMERRRALIAGRLRRLLEQMSPRGRRALVVALEDIVRVQGGQA